MVIVEVTLAASVRGVEKCSSHFSAAARRGHPRFPGTHAALATRVRGAFTRTPGGLGDIQASCALRRSPGCVWPPAPAVASAIGEEEVPLLDRAAERVAAILGHHIETARPRGTQAARVGGPFGGAADELPTAFGDGAAAGPVAIAP